MYYRYARDVYKRQLSRIMVLRIALLLIRGRGIVSMSRLILDYLWQRRQLLLFYLLTIGIFVIIQQLGGQEMAYAWYAVFLVTVILLSLIHILTGE